MVWLVWFGLAGFSEDIAFTRHFMASHPPPPSHPASQSSENTAMADQSTIATTSSSQEKLYYYCRCPEDGLMIACDNTECKIEWFHQDCVELTSIPAGIGIALIIAICHNF